MTKWFMDIDWDTKCEDLAVDEAWQNSCLIINQAMNQLVPSCSSKCKKTPRLMNKVANSSMKYKSKMWYRYRQSTSNNDLVEIRVVPNKAVKEYRGAKNSSKKISKKQ